MIDVKSMGISARTSSLPLKAWTAPARASLSFEKQRRIALPAPGSSANREPGGTLIASHRHMLLDSGTQGLLPETEMTLMLPLARNISRVDSAGSVARPLRPLRPLY